MSDGYNRHPEPEPSAETHYSLIHIRSEQYRGLRKGSKPTNRKKFGEAEENFFDLVSQITKSCSALPQRVR